MEKEELYKIIRREIRCNNCNKLLMKLKVWGNYSLQIICPRCKCVNEINVNRYFDKSRNVKYNVGSE